MKKEDILVNGRLEYMNVEFVFVFDGVELRLIPQKEKAYDLVLQLMGSPLAEGAYAINASPKIDVPFMSGICNENGEHYVFITRIGDVIGIADTTLYIRVLGFIRTHSQIDNICKLSFFSPEINCIYPVNQAVRHCYNHEGDENHVVYTLKIVDYESTTTTKREFEVDENTVKVSFGISKEIDTKITENPITINSSMNFEFDSTSDYQYILRLWRIAREFIRFLCYRKNIIFNRIGIFAPEEKGRVLRIGELIICDNQEECEPDTLKQGRYIKQEYIDGYEGFILSDLAKNLLYTRHIPISYSSGRHIDAARFVMITAAFEWEFHRRYPEGVPKSASTLNVENQAENAIQELIIHSTGKLKKKYHFLKGQIRSDSLQTEVIQMGKDFDCIIGEFGRYLYKINGEVLQYSTMGERFANQRNHFAHGDLDKEFIGASLLDIVFMEYVIYALQLKGYGVVDDRIRKAINNLFHLNFDL